MELAYNLAEFGAAMAEPWNSDQVGNCQNHFLAVAVVTVELAHVVGAAGAGHHYDSGLV